MVAGLLMRIRAFPSVKRATVTAAEKVFAFLAQAVRTAKRTLLPEVPDKVRDIVLYLTAVENLGELSTMVGLMVKHVKQNLPEVLDKLPAR